MMPALQARAASLAACTLIAGMLSGCSLFHRGAAIGCSEPPFTTNTGSRPPLQVPEGLSAPDARNAVKIPTLSEPERVRPRSAACLSSPPSYAVAATDAVPAKAPFVPPPLHPAPSGGASE